MLLKHTPLISLVRLGAPSAEDPWEGTHASLLSPSFVLSLSRMVGCCSSSAVFSLSSLCCFGCHLLPAIKGWLRADILLAYSWSFMKGGQEALEVAGRAEWWLLHVLWLGRIHSLSREFLWFGCWAWQDSSQEKMCSSFSFSSHGELSLLILSH